MACQVIDLDIFKMVSMRCGPQAPARDSPQGPLTWKGAGPGRLLAWRLSDFPGLGPGPPSAEPFCYMLDGFRGCLRICMDPTSFGCSHFEADSLIEALVFLLFGQRVLGISPVHILTLRFMGHAGV